ncbi:MAG TPA: 3-oxoacyl-[acyl-carrier-protein] reductase, partial [Candidatus Omnitrophota bacterium]|nr:3-oxoacyl-[acyl-carrier-protein] reductase [Candidatus Omnitrophota bacterium]
MLLKDRLALITGGSRGIGREIALAFAREGANLAVCDISPEGLENVRKEIEALGVKCEIYEADVQKKEQVDQTVQKILDTQGRIDILVNNAGVTKDNLIARMSESEWDLVLSINLKGTFLFTKAVCRSMIREGRGKIVNIASVIGLVGNLGQANYSASKAGVIALTKSAAREFARKNICVNAIAPGFIETQMTQALQEEMKQKALGGIPLGRFGKASDIAETALFLASDKADYITGQVIV